MICLLYIAITLLVLSTYFTVDVILSLLSLFFFCSFISSLFSIPLIQISNQMFRSIFKLQTIFYVLSWTFPRFRFLLLEWNPIPDHFLCILDVFHVFLLSYNFWNLFSLQIFIIVPDIHKKRLFNVRDRPFADVIPYLLLI